MKRTIAILVLALVLVGGDAAAPSPAIPPVITDLWVVNADGSHLRRLTHDAGVDFQPAVSPNGRLIAWVQGTPSQIWKMRLGGTQKRQLTSLSEDSFDPQWSPNGSRIAFTSWDHSQCQPGVKWCAFTNVWVINADGSNPRLLGPGLHPRWAPDSRGLVYYKFEPNVETSGLMVSELDENGGAGHIFLPTYYDSPLSSPPAWSRRRWIAFTYGVSTGRERVDVVRSTGTPRRQIGVGTTPAWSPDGKTLAVVRRGAIWLSDPVGGHRRMLGNVFAGAGPPPVWSPNGRLLAFLGRSGLVVVRAVGPTRPRLVADGAFYCCDYYNGTLVGASPPAWTHDSKRVIFAQVRR